MRTWVLITRNHVKARWSSISCFPGIGLRKDRWNQGSWCSEMVSSRISNGSSLKIMWRSDSGNHPYQPLVPTDLTYTHSGTHHTSTCEHTHRGEEKGKNWDHLNKQRGIHSRGETNNLHCEGLRTFSSWRRLVISRQLTWTITNTHEQEWAKPLACYVEEMCYIDMRQKNSSSNFECN